MHSSDSLDAANRIAFNQQTKDRLSLFDWGACTAHNSVMRFGNCASALGAAKAFVSFAVFAEAFTCDVAVPTSYFDPCFLRAIEPK